MKTVWKYDLPLQDHIVLSLPEDAQVLCVGMQCEKPRLWVLVNPKAPKEIRKFRLARTGHPITEENLNYIGTVSVRGGLFIFHLFERRE